MTWKSSFKRGRIIAPLILLFLLILSAMGTAPTAQAQEQPPATPTPAGETIRYTVEPGDTLGKLAQAYDTTVAELVALNEIENPDLIYVGQALLIPIAAAPTPTPQPGGGPLTLTWSIVDWRPADPDYVATVRVDARGGTPPYTIYHDGLVQDGETFEIAWRRCLPKPGSVAVSDATGAHVQDNYWLDAPYCPTGIQIRQPEEGEHLKNTPRDFNVTWNWTVDPPPPAFGIEVEVWRDGGWQPWLEDEQERDARPLYFVTGFPGDLGGRVRMWGIYGQHAAPKTPWRTFEFRVTY
jgi:LysM repeat protein